MHPELTYQLSLARIEDLKRHAAVNRRLAARTARVEGRTWWRRRWRYGRAPRASMTERFA
jgi:hypothetical protein